MAINLNNGILQAVIEPKGAELISLKSGSREYMWEGNPYYWGKHSPILFPIVGTLKGNSYTYDGKKYEMSRHGFARDLDFEVIAHTEDSASFLLKDNQSTLEMYPFPFELLVTYRIAGSTLQIGYSVKNTGTHTMPFSLGAHPAFALKEPIEAYALFFQKDQALLCHKLENDLIGTKTQELSLEGNKLRLGYDLFKDDALILKTLSSDYVALHEHGKSVLRVSFSGFPSLGLWTKPGAPFLCIEPWQGYADSTDASGDITRKEGIRLLDVQDIQSFGLEISMPGF